MRAPHKALLLTLLQVAIICSLGGKLLLDRATRPRYWLKAAVLDPDLPIRGRYVALNLEVPVRGVSLPPLSSGPGNGSTQSAPTWTPPAVRRDFVRVKLVPEPQGLVAVAQTPVNGSPYPSGVFEQAQAPGLFGATLSEDLRNLPQEKWWVRLQEPVAFFLPEHAPDPSRRAAGEELWVEVTLPRKGPPRPIRLGVKKDGLLTLLKL